MRVIISDETRDFIDVMLIRANEGFAGGEVTKSDIANWAIMCAGKTFDDGVIKTLRTVHCNERKMIGALLRSSAEDGSDLPEDIKRAIREHYGLVEQNKKKSPKVASELSTGKNVDNSNAA